MTGSVSCWFNYICLIRISLHSVVFNIISTHLKPQTIAIQTAAWSSMEPAEFQFSLAVYESKMWPWAYKILWIALCQSYPCSTKMTFFSFLFSQLVFLSWVSHQYQFLLLFFFNWHVWEDLPIQVPLPCIFYVLGQSIPVSFRHAGTFLIAFMQAEQ